MTRIAIILFSLLVFQSCRKDDDPPPVPPVPPPRDMQVVSGNDQLGYPGRMLYDSIIIKVTPENIEDLPTYLWSYTGLPLGSSPTATSYIRNGEYYISIAWTLAYNNINAQQFTVVLLGCRSYGNCKPLDSVLVKATVNARPWVKVFNPAPTHGEIRDIYFTDANHGVAVGDYETGVAITNDGGSSWNLVSSTRDDYYDVAFADKDTGMAIVTNNYAYFTVDGGNTFEQGLWTPPVVGHLSTSDYLMINRNTIFAVGNQGNIHKTADGGQSWTRYNGFNFINGLKSITCIDANICYACGDVAKIIKTTNGGDSWTEQPVLVNNNLRKIYFADKDFGFAGGQQGMLLRTTNGGAAWTVVKPGIRGDIMEIRFFGNTGFVVSSLGEIAKTTDAGLTWSVIVRDSYPIHDVNKAVIKDATVVYAAENQIIYKYDLQ